MAVVQVSYRSEVLNYNLYDETTAGELGRKIVKDTGVAWETIKLIFKDARGRTVSVQPSREPDALLLSKGSGALFQLRELQTYRSCC